MGHNHHERRPVTVTPYEDGPLLIRGDFLLRTPTGEIIEAGRSTVALCRCGRSGTRPFCDGSHRAAGFRAAATPDPTPGGECRLRPSPDPIPTVSDPIPTVPDR